MISRRTFIKRLFSLLALTAGSGFLASKWFGGGKDAVQSLAQPPADPGPGQAQSASEHTPAPLLSLFLLSDVHVSSADNAIGDKLHTALKDITRFESPMETIVFGGDITDFGRDIEYKQLKNILNDYKLPPYYANMGNHDYYDIWVNARGEFSTDTMPNGKTDAMARERFMKFFGYKEKPYLDVWVKDVHLILLSQEAYVQEKADVGEGAWYSDEQLAWFRETMKAHKDARPALVFIHQPLPAPGTDGGSHRLIRAKEFRAILEPYKNVFVFSGHTHRNFVGESHYNTENSFHWFNNASVGKTRSASPDVPAIQGMYIQVFPHQIVVRGREFSTKTWIPGAEYTVPIQA